MLSYIEVTTHCNPDHNPLYPGHAAPTLPYPQPLFESYHGVYGTVGRVTVVCIVCLRSLIDKFYDKKPAQTNHLATH